MFVFDIWCKYKTTKFSNVERVQHVFQEIRDSFAVPDCDKENFSFEELRSRITCICGKLFVEKISQYGRSGSGAAKRLAECFQTFLLDSFSQPKPSISTTLVAATENRGRPRRRVFQTHSTKKNKGAISTKRFNGFCSE